MLLLVLRLHQSQKHPCVLLYSQQSSSFDCTSQETSCYHVKELLFQTPETQMRSPFHLSHHGSGRLFYRIEGAQLSQLYPDRPHHPSHPSNFANNHQNRSAILEHLEICLPFLVKQRRYTVQRLFVSCPAFYACGQRDHTDQNIYCRPLPPFVLGKLLVCVLL